MSERIISRSLKSKVWDTFYGTSDSALKYADETFSKINMSLQQFIILSTIKRIEPPVTQSLVAKRVGRNPYSITLIIDRMEKDGLVKRIKDLKDRRSSRLVVTAKGQQFYDRAIDTAKTIPDRLLSCLSREELMVLNKLLKIVGTQAQELRKIYKNNAIE